VRVVADTGPLHYLVLIGESKFCRICSATSPSRKLCATSSTGRRLPRPFGHGSVRHRRGLIDLAAAFDALKTTNFHTRPALLDVLLAAWKNDSRP
jgi:hypothetical protein